MFTLHPLNIFSIYCPHFLSIINFPYILLDAFSLSLTLSTLHNVPFSLGTLSFKCLLSMHMRYAPICIHKAGSMCLVPIITPASPQLVIMQYLKCLFILCCDFFDTELMICASIINVCSGGNFSLFTLGCVVCICCLNIPAWIELQFLFLGHA